MLKTECYKSVLLTHQHIKLCLEHACLVALCREPAAKQIGYLTQVLSSREKRPFNLSNNYDPP
ncbi:hypothetical protein Mapa_012898 [Marchantia paleacea]|nr:hypothetical protein Mapa_012898 [Marchantia paleacea]